MFIRDEIHGDIYFSDIEQRVIDTDDFQRLRRVKQLGLTYLVYPSANHTRFEHSIGTLSITKKILENIEIDDSDLVVLYGLVHDIGHTAFSHETEKITKSIIGDHEDIGVGKIKNGEIGDIISENYSLRKFCSMFRSKKGGIVHSSLGSDRLDYLLRDSKNTGVAYGMIDLGRVLRVLDFNKRSRELFVKESGLETAESILIARFMMFSAVYLHDTVRCASSMLQYALELMVDCGELDPDVFVNMDDSELLFSMKNSSIGEVSEMAGRIIRRDLYKVAASIEAGKIEPEEAHELEKELSSSLNCPVIIDFPYSFADKSDISIMTGNGIVPLSSVSEFVSLLELEVHSRSRVLVCVPKEKRKTAEKILKGKHY